MTSSLSERSVRVVVAQGLVCVLLSACNAALRSPASQTEGSRPATFEQQQLALAHLQASQGHLADAATHWEVLSVLKPKEPSYARQLAQLHAQIEQEASKEMRLAKAAHQRGAIDEASQHYLAVLALQPDNTAAADALRAIERDRNKRDHLERYTRLPLSNSLYKDSGQAGGLTAQLTAKP